MSSFAKRLTDRKAQDVARQVGEMFKPLPKAPKGLIEFLVKIVPLLVLIGAILCLLASPIVGVTSIISLITFNPMIVLGNIFTAFLTLATAIILFMAYKPLLKRKHDGWMYLFWSAVLGLVQTLGSIVLGRAGVFSLIGSAIGFYLLYQMHDWYKK